MLNAEKYKEQINKYQYGFSINKKDGKLCSCLELNQCSECIFSNHGECGVFCGVRRIKWLLSEATEEILDSEGNVIEIGDLCKFGDDNNKDLENVNFLEGYNKCQSIYYDFEGNDWAYCIKTTAEEAKKIIQELG